MTFQSLLKLLLVGVLALLVSSCQTTRRTLNLDTSVALAVDIKNDVNPDSDGRASPVVVRVFMLADDRQFAREDFLNLYENAQSRLGKDLINTVVLKEFAPGEQRVETLDLTPEVKYIGLLAEFVRYQEADALMVLPITDHKENEYQVALSGTRIGTPKEIAMHRKSSDTQRSGDRKEGQKTVTISSAEYERMRAQLENMEETGQ
ncbi:type VI secretion system lipoprotein TssJ [Microbulbifer hainanensis]|uniref:type VI secretion system lipoprotein TssJ n=1 Tax=Microbulbifer hainanensis TaxID=2735675 RepID=UPI0029C0A6FE|nr:type VI secretion system lipoprotein TssJ [Microbulbifer hainanensis]